MYLKINYGHFLPASPSHFIITPHTNLAAGKSQKQNVRERWKTVKFELPHDNAKGIPKLCIITIDEVSLNNRQDVANSMEQNP